MTWVASCKFSVNFLLIAEFGQGLLGKSKHKYLFRAVFLVRPLSYQALFLMGGHSFALSVPFSISTMNKTERFEGRREHRCKVHTLCQNFAPLQKTL
jgi:hypothetical protein